ncbi:MAG TPA: GerAB/ArcD/ProY family transporter [Firmicutes bacterium]|nr:GerAB/ArcD/ProY family transporter [Bacillota bacterium]
MENRNRITAKQLGVFILSAQVGLGVIALPSTLAKEVGHDGWISILSAGLLSTLIIIVVIALLRRYSHQSILEINRSLFGKVLGPILNLLLILYLSFSMVAAFRYFTEFIKLFTLEATPEIFLALLIIAPTVYLSWYGLKPVARFSRIIFFILFSFLMLSIVVLPKVQFTFLMPVGAADLARLGQSLVPATLAFIGLELTVFLYPHISDQENTLKWVIGANLCTMAFITIIFLVTTGLFGENLLQTQVAPLFNLARYCRAPYLDRIDLLFILLWFPLLESTFRSYFFTTYDSLRRSFSFKKQKLVYGLYTGLTILLSRLPKDFIQATQLAKVVNLSGIAVFGFLILCYFYSLIKRRSVKSK